MYQAASNILDLTHFYRMTNGQIQSKLLSASIALKVFNHLCEPVTARAVAEAIGCHPGNTELLLDGLAASRVITKSKGHYQNRPEAQEALVEGRPTYIGELFTLMMQLHHAPLENLLELIRQGPWAPAKDADMTEDGIWVRYAAALGNYLNTGAARQAVEIASGLPEFSSFKKMLDLGGGPGIIGLAIVAAHPDMTGIIFDLPAVTRVAEKFITAYKMEHRVSVMGGDYMSDTIGQGYDLIWASATLNFAGPDLDKPVKKIFDALNPGGVFISLSDGLTCEGTQPADYILGKLPGALMGQDIGIEQGAIAESMVRAGFPFISSRTITTAMIPMDLDIARKSTKGYRGSTLRC